MNDMDRYSDCLDRENDEYFDSYGNYDYIYDNEDENPFFDPDEKEDYYS